VSFSPVPKVPPLTASCLPGTEERIVKGCESAATSPWMACARKFKTDFTIRASKLCLALWSQHEPAFRMVSVGEFEVNDVAKVARLHVCISGETKSASDCTWINRSHPRFEGLCSCSGYTGNIPSCIVASCPTHHTEEE